MNELTNNEIQIIQGIWSQLDFYQSSPNVDISGIKFKFFNINYFQGLLLLNEHEVLIRDIDAIMYQFDQLIQLISLVVINLKYPGKYSEYLLKFSKINSRIYDLDLPGFCQLLLLTILQIKPMENHHQLIFIKFLTLFVESINNLSEEILMGSTNEDYRLSYSDSNLSTLSLHNDNNSLLTIEQEFARSVDIESLAKVETNTFSSDIDSDSDDNTYDFLNSFNSETNTKKSKPLRRFSMVKSAKSKKPSNPLKSNDMKSVNNLSKIPSITSTKTKQLDCIIM